MHASISLSLSPVLRALSLAVSRSLAASLSLALYLSPFLGALDDPWVTEHQPEQTHSV